MGVLKLGDFILRSFEIEGAIMNSELCLFP